MAEITTTKKILQVGADPKKTFDAGVEPGRVRLTLENELVEHVARLTPQEAVAIGVSMIQLAYQAQAMEAYLAQQQAQVVETRSRSQEP